MVKKIDIKPAVLDHGTIVSVQVLKYIDGSLSEDNTYTFDANAFDTSRSASNPYVADILFGDAYTEEILGDTTQCYFDGVVCSPNDAYTLSGLVEDDVTAYSGGSGGTGDVVGPASSTDENIVLFDGATGKLIQDSGVKIADLLVGANHGPVAYVSSSGDNDSAEVGNITKPYLTIGAAIDDLAGNSDATIVILSSTGTQTINDYDFNTIAYSLNIHVLCASATLEFTGSCTFGALKVKSLGGVTINTDLVFSYDDTIFIECYQFSIPSSAQGTIEMYGDVKANFVYIDTNASVSITLHNLFWTTLANIGATAGFQYNYITPLKWVGKISQSDTTPPTIDTVLENSLGESLTTSYIGTGVYSLNSALNLFSETYTTVEFSSSNYDAIGAVYAIQRGDITADKIRFVSFDAFGSLIDTFITNNTVKIEVYFPKH